MSDSQIIESVLKGRTHAFEDLVERYLPLVRAICASHAGPDDATRDDLVQESFLRAYLNLPKLRKPDRFGPWIGQVARNTCRSWLRKRSVQQRAAERMAAEDTPAAAEADPARADLYAWLRREMEALPGKTREAMLLVYAEGLSSPEAAHQLAIGEAALRKRLQYGREKVSERLWEALEPAEAGGGPFEPRAGLTKKVLAGLPLGSAPWLEAGAAGAAGLGIGAWAAWLAGGVAIVGAAAGIVLYAAGALGSHPEPARAALDPPEAHAAAAASEEESADAGSPPSHDLTVKVAYRVTRMEPIPSGGFQHVTEAGPPVEGAVVKLAPLVFHRDRALAAMEAMGGVPDDFDAVAPFVFHTEYVPPERLRAQIAEVRAKMTGTPPPDFDAMSDAERKAFMEEQRRLRRMRLNAWTRGTPVREAVTDAQGRARFENLPEARYEVWLDRPEASSSRAGAPHPRRFWPLDVEGVCEVLIEDTVSALRGRVVDAATGKPIGAARLTLKGPIAEGFATKSGMGDITVHAKSDGFFDFEHYQEVGYGAFELRVRPPDGYLPHPPIEGVREVGVPLESITIALEPRAAVSGRVLTADGEPAAGVTIMRQVAAGHSWHGEASSDPDGSYVLRHDGGLIRAYASGRGGARSETLDVELAPDEPLSHDFVLARHGTIRLNFRLPDGSLPESIDSIDLDIEKNPNSSHSMGFNMPNPGESGYTIPFVAPGIVQAAATVAGYEPAYLERQPLEPGETVTWQADLQPAREHLGVRVADDHGRPMPGKTVAIRFPRTHTTASGARSTSTLYAGQADTDANGFALIEGLWPGEFSVDVWGAGASVEAEVTLPRREPLELVVPSDDRPERPQAFPLDLAVYDAATGTPLTVGGSASVLVVYPDGRFDDRGWSASPAVRTAAGTSYLFLIKPGYTAGITRVEMPPDGEPRPDVQMELGEGGRLYGQAEGERYWDLLVYPAEVWPLAWATVEEGRLEHEARRLGAALARGTQLSGNGEWQLDLLPRGEYVVVLADYSEVQAVSQPVRVEPGRATGPVELVPLAAQE
jgi:RNA polymerase sigma factor (sigma-70 family)